MYLNDLNRTEKYKILKTQSILDKQFSVNISETSSLDELYELYENLVEDNQNLESLEYNLESNPQYTRNLLMMENIKLLIESKENVSYDRTYENVLGNLVEYIGNSLNTKEPIGINEALDMYSQTKHKQYDENVLRSVLEQFFFDVLPENDDDYMDIDPKRPFSNIDPDTRKAADELLRKMRTQKQPKGSQKYSKDDLTKAKQAARKRAKKQLRKYKPSMMSKLKNVFGMGESPLNGKISMKENYVKKLRALLENEVEQAEVLIAAKGFAQELQGMIEKIGRLQNEDLGPVTSRMRETFGNDMADNFNHEMDSLLQEILDNLKTTQTRISTSVSDIANGQMPSMANDMSADLELDTPVGDADLELDVPVDDEFAGDDSAAGPEDELLGRSKKEESIRNLRNKLAETKKLIARAKKLKENKS